MTKTWKRNTIQYDNIACTLMGFAFLAALVIITKHCKTKQNKKA